MPVIPLGVEAYKRSDGFVPEVRCLNMYLEPDKSGISPDQTLRVQRPGLTRTTTLNGPIRGLDYRSSTDERIAVGGQSFYVNGTEAGTIEGIDPVALVNTAFVQVAVANNTAYLYDTTFSAVAMPDGRSVIDADQLNQYVVLFGPDARFYWIVPGETTVDPLNFATAESLPDGGVGVCRVGDEIWFFGTDSVEPWQPTGDADAPFQRAIGRQYERGALSRDSIRRFDNTVMWVSSDCQVCRGGSVPQVVSGNDIAERIRKRTGDVSAWTLIHDGHEFYVLRIPGQGTLAYDAVTQQWCEFGTLGKIEWDAHVGYSRQGVTVTGSASSGAIWTLDGNNGTDDGLAIERAVSATVPILGERPRNDSISVGVGASADCTIRIRWKDGQDAYPAYYEELEARAPFDVVNLYRCGMPQQPYRTVEVSCIDAARIRIAGALANQAWQ